MIRKKAAKKKTAKKKVSKKKITKKKGARKKAAAKRSATRIKTTRKKVPAKKKSAAAKKKPAARKKAATTKKKASPGNAGRKKTSTATRTRKKKVVSKGGQRKKRHQTAMEKMFANAPEVIQKATHISKKELTMFRKLLLKARDEHLDEFNFLASDSLTTSRDSAGDLSNYSMHMADQGTDNFNRDFALNRVSNEQHVLYEIDRALERIKRGVFGVCQLTGNPIEKERLRAIPYTRFCVAAQEDLEKGQAKYRPFGPTMTHGR